MGTKVKHKVKHRTHKRKPSKFSLFSHKIADVFKEIVEVPEEELEKEVVDTPVEEVVESIIEEPEEVASVEQEYDPLHEEIVQQLNKAASEWKETGDTGLHLTAPVSFRSKIKSFWSKLKHSDNLSPRLKKRVDEIVNKASVRLANADESVVREEWEGMLEKMEEKITSAERLEIEKIYKELSEK